MAKNPTASSFVKGYHACHDAVDGQQLVSHDNFKPGQFEFLNCMLKIAEFLARDDVKIFTCYHKYSPLGQFRIGSSPLDLAIVYFRKDKKGRWPIQPQYAFFNMNHQFTHSCDRGCAPLKSYIGGKTSEMLIEKTRLVDEMHQKFLSALFAQKRYTYETVYSCHRETELFICPFTGHRAKSILQLFRTTPNAWLRGLIDWFPREKTLDLIQLQQLIRRETVQCFVVATGKVDDSCATYGHQMGHVITRRDGYQISAHSTFSPTLFDGATLAYLIDRRGFKLERPCIWHFSHLLPIL
jgi:hypothetical protein